MQKNPFSQQLIDETVKCFKEENGIDVSEKQAVEILENLAGLFLAFSASSGSDDSFFNAPTDLSGVEKKSPNPNSSSPDLIYAHNCNSGE